MEGDQGLVDTDLLDYQRQYLDFLDDEEDQGVYQRRVKIMIEDKRCRLLVNVNDVRRKNPQRANGLLNSTFQEQVAFQKALKEYVSTIDPVYASEVEDFYIAFEGSFGNKHVTPRTLSARFLGCMVCVEGIVTRSSLVRPKVVRSVHYCPATAKTIERRYTDLTSYDPFPSGATYPTKDDDGNLLETEYGMSVYKDHQTVTIQEMPEKSPAGQLPRSVDIICDGDLVDVCKPGDRVQIVGNYRCLPNKQGGFTSGAFRTIVIANHIAHLSKEAQLVVTREDVLQCRKLARKKNIFEMLSHSLAPSIHGHEYIKKAILCLLLGGLEKILPNGTRLRGDINVLLIGDPSVAKSQLLRYVLNTAPRAVTTTGRGSSGVGLTAAVTTDNETGERRLEAGAMVLADRGVVCIDEFDKMSDIDRTAIHEVMEQGRVTISKAGIHARLNARCSVLAAANPVYGKYDSFRTPMENIGLQDSLLSRFDLLFVMLDKIDADHDGMIADHVVRMHRYRSPNEQDGEVLPMASSADMLSTQDYMDDEDSGSIWEKYDAVLHGTTRSKTDQILTACFMKKYIHIAKIVKPVLTTEASEKIAEKYSRLRCLESVAGNEARTQPVTVRTLETLIRLATAHAKCRLSRTIDGSDADVAIELIQFALFKEGDGTTEGGRSSENKSEDNYQSVDENQPEEQSEKTKFATKKGLEAKAFMKAKIEAYQLLEFFTKDVQWETTPDDDAVTAPTPVALEAKECNSFGSFLAAKLLSLSPQVRAVVEHKCCKILLKASQGKFDEDIQSSNSVTPPPAPAPSRSRAQTSAMPKVSANSNSNLMSAPHTSTSISVSHNSDSISGQNSTASTSAQLPVSMNHNSTAMSAPNFTHGASDSRTPQVSARHNLNSFLLPISRTPSCGFCGCTSIMPPEFLPYSPAFNFVPASLLHQVPVRHNSIFLAPNSHASTFVPPEALPHTSSSITPIFHLPSNHPVLQVPMSQKSNFIHTTTPTHPNLPMSHKPNCSSASNFSQASTVSHPKAPASHKSNSSSASNFSQASTVSHPKAPASHKSNSGSASNFSQHATSSHPKAPASHKSNSSSASNLSQPATSTYPKVPARHKANLSRRATPTSLEAILSHKSALNLNHALTSKLSQIPMSQSSLDLLSTCNHSASSMPLKIVVLEKPKKSRRGEDGDDSQDDDDDDDAGGSSRRGKRTRAQRSEERGERTERSEYDFSEGEDEPTPSRTRSKRQRRDPAAEPAAEAAPEQPAGDIREAVFDQPPVEVPKLPDPTEISNERLKKFKGVMANAFRQDRANVLPFKTIMKALNHDNEPEPFTEGEAAAAVIRMTNDNLIYHADAQIYLL